MPDEKQKMSYVEGISGSAQEEPKAEGFVLSLRRIRRILNESREAQERRQAVQQLMPRLWDAFPWQRYQAACILTTRVYLPSAVFVFEWGSFPSVLVRELRGSQHTLPPTFEAQREILRQTLVKMLMRWLDHSVRSKSRKRGEAAINMDVAADVCEAIGRLGIVEAEQDLLDIVRYFRSGNNQVRETALVALAALPPEQLRLTWGWLQNGSQQERAIVGSALHYMTLPEAVPFLLEALPIIASDTGLQQSVAIPLLQALGQIGDPSALPDLNAIARADQHPLQPTARKAIQRIMKEAAGHEEVTLVRASAASTLYEDVLLRPSSSERDADLHTEQLLRATTMESSASPNKIDQNQNTEREEAD